MTRSVFPRGSSAPVKATPAVSSTGYHDLVVLAISKTLCAWPFLLDDTDARNASSTSVSRSRGSDRETHNLWRHEIPVDANLAFWVPQAIKKGEMKCGRRERSWFRQHV